MTRIEINSGKLNLVPEYLDAIIDAIQTHGENLSSIKNQCLSIAKSTCDYDNNGRIHVKDTYKNTRVRVDPPDRTTNYQHMHVYDENKKLLDVDGNVVKNADPKGHIKWDG